MNSPKARKLLLLIGSPRKGQSTSASIGHYLTEALVRCGWEQQVAFTHDAVKDGTGRDELRQAFLAADLCILGFPVYCDSLPAPVIETLTDLVAHTAGAGNRRKCGFIAFANCGFPERVHTELALAMCKLFAHEAGLDWLGGLGIGGGGVIGGTPLAKIGGRAMALRRGLDMVADCLNQGLAMSDEAIDLVCRPIIPRWLYRLIGNIGWYATARKNKTAVPLNYRPYG